MGTRRRSREQALQALFYVDMGHSVDPADAVAAFCNCFKPSKQSYAYFVQLVEGVISKRDRIDAVIEQFSKNWKLHRMSAVDRNVLRIAVFELMYCSADVPPKVVINEAIDIGKKFGSEESGAFINGILDSIRIEAPPDGPGKEPG